MHVAIEGVQGSFVSWKEEEREGEKEEGREKRRKEGTRKEKERTTGKEKKEEKWRQTRHIGKTNIPDKLLK